MFEKDRSQSVSLFILTPFFASLTALGGFIYIPFVPVPITLQTLFVYLAGDFLGSKRGALSQIIFLFIGLSGIPVFTRGGGIGYIFQPTFGYLVAFPMACWMIGWMIPRMTRKKRWIKIFIANSVGMMIILFIGVLYLFLNVNFIIGQHLSLKQSIWSGIIIFLPGELVKICLASSITQRLRSTIRIETPLES